MMDFSVMASWAAIAITILGGVYKFGQQRQEMVGLKDDLDECKARSKADLDELRAHNSEQHRELYESRNDMSAILTRLTALFEAMEKKQDSMDKKLDILIERRSSERG